MKSRVYFEEEQKMDSWWLRIMVMLISVAALMPVYYGLVSQLIFGEPWGNEPMPDAGLIVLAIVVTVVTAGVMFMIFASRLVTKVLPEGIHINYFPFFRDRLIRKERIERYAVRKYKPLIEYGGWGVRYSLKRGRAYNASGNMGMQLFLKDDKKILIGTQRPEAFKRAMDKLMSV